MRGAVVFGTGSDRVIHVGAASVENKAPGGHSS
jgi:hypothetical protein